MSWDKFVDLYKIGSRFKDVSIEKVIFLKPHLNEFLSSFLNERKGCILYGPPGTGKTFTILAMIRKVLTRFPMGTVRFFKSKSLDDKIMENFKDQGGSSYFIRSVCETPWLFIDDFGVDRDTERMGRDIFEIVDHRWENELPIIISTNLSIEDLIDKYGDRVISRLQDYSWINFDDGDLRGNENISKQYDNYIEERKVVLFS